MLDRQSPKPLHIQFENIIRQKINDEEWPLNTVIPSENEMSKIYGISRMTVRSVLNRFVADGMLYRVPGKGTFVAEPKIVSRPLSHMGIQEQLEGMGYEITTKLLSLEHYMAPAWVAKKLEIIANSRVYVIKRIRFIKDVPFSLHTSYIPADICSGLEDQDLEGMQLCDILEQVYDCEVIRRVETLESTTAGEEETQLFGVKNGYPLLVLENLAYTSKMPIEYSQVIFRGDKIKLRLEYGQ